MKREFLQELRVGDMALPKEVVDAIMAENGKDIQHYKLQAGNWEEKYNSAVADHAKQLAALHFQGRLEAAVSRAGGRNAKAISALLDLEGLAAQTDQEAALDQAMEALKEEHGYLFEANMPPAYAGGTGTTPVGMHSPDSLSSALRQRFGKQ